MNIFIDERRGTPITQEEREWIEKEIRELEAYRADEDQLAADAQANREEGMSAFDRDVIVMCIDADIFGMKRTLEQGRVILW